MAKFVELQDIVAERIVFVDVETSGLDEDENQLLEVAALVTDTELNILDDEGYHAVIQYSPTEVEWIKSKTDDYVVNMHTVSGLWDRLPSGKHISEVEQELLAYIQKYAPEKRTARLGGNSVALDKAFIGKHLPSVSEHLHYRVIDVSTVAALAGWWWKTEAFHKELRHEAMSDIRESIAELKYLRQLMQHPF